MVIYWSVLVTLWSYIGLESTREDTKKNLKKKMKSYMQYKKSQNKVYNV